MSKIAKIIARQILDSRGNPTVEVELYTEKGVISRASVPSGASTGSREALELRDGDKSYYLGKSVKKAITNINEILAPEITGMEVSGLRDIDEKMISLDGTEFKSKVGANAMLAISMAVCRAGALEAKKPLYVYLKENLSCPNACGYLRHPAPLMNIINGGAHASNNLDIQEFMIVPHLKASFSENLRAGVEVFHHLKKVLSNKGYSTNVGDEGGFAPDIVKNEEAIALITKSIKRAGFKPGIDVSICLDIASNELYKNGKYSVQSSNFDDPKKTIDYYLDLIDKYPIKSIEDPFAESDWLAWNKIIRSIKKVQIVGDDLLVTSINKIKTSIAKDSSNTVLIKPNQVGTISETLNTINFAHKNNLNTIISHRSGDTEDSFIADLAIGTQSTQLKSGAPARSERTAKYNRISEIISQNKNINYLGLRAMKI